MADKLRQCLLLVSAALFIQDIRCNRVFATADEKDLFSLDESCDQHSCYPKYGDIMIGRQDRIVATSTCGQRRQERYCVLNDISSTSTTCSVCNTNVTGYNHDIDNVVVEFGKRSRDTWWQSKNGEQAVSIRVDLEAEFHFTHLILNFKSAKPFSLMIERSPDYGKTWKPYRYWSENCGTDFPHISTAPMRNESDIVCISKTSSTGITPLTNTDFVFKVLEPSMHIKDPYTPSIQNLLKMTNLRINFTRMHTLGDNYLDTRKSITEKYYYALYSIVLRGSCSCYGHAKECKPAQGSTRLAVNKVYGHCICQHNTDGENCQKCKGFYQDLPWKPAVGKQTHICKRCECNEHATACRFDAGLYTINIRERGIESGGICKCKHNTDGQHCEYCASKHYRNPNVPRTHENTCLRCNCDPFGSEGSNTFESECVQEDDDQGRKAGDCLCKQNVIGARCDRCKNGFWNMAAENKAGCERIGQREYLNGDPTCKCHEYGTVDNGDCNKNNGRCTCKRNVVGDSCDRCHEGYWGLGLNSDGCIQCDCNEGGSTGNTCRNSDGQCRCREGIVGRKCDQTQVDKFLPNLGYIIMEAEFATGEVAGYPAKHHVISRTSPNGVKKYWTGIGFMQVTEGARLNFEMPPSKIIPMSMRYNLYIKYDNTETGWDKVEVVLNRHTQIEDPICAEHYRESDDRKIVSLDPRSRYINAGSFCLEIGKSYNIKLNFHKQFSGKKSSKTMLIDSIALLPVSGDLDNRNLRNMATCVKEELELDMLPSEVCNNKTFVIMATIYDKALSCGCDRTGAYDQNCKSIGGQCNCKPNVIGRRCDKCTPGTHSMNVHGCKECNCNSLGSVDNICKSDICTCKANVVGHKCDKCMYGYYDFKRGCIKCQCNNRAETCDETGCIDCRDNTGGTYCESCLPGFYGIPSTSGCKRCQCPGGSSGIQIAETCRLDSRTNQAICDCPEGYAGAKCDRCADNYFGDPTRPGNSCKPCRCNGNLDPDVPGNCDTKTGECLKCTRHTTGIHCQRCQDGYHGDATINQCVPCRCFHQGTDPSRPHCDHQTGKCHCNANVVGDNCDRCRKNFWKIISVNGCEACNCDSTGSRYQQCDEADGSCVCLDRRGGRTCNECVDNHYGDPKVQCHTCDCDRTGSRHNRCNPQTGQCVCQEGMGGRRCDRCARGTTGVMPRCVPCGPCFDNWDDIIQQLRERTAKFLEIGNGMVRDGVEGRYDVEFQSIQDLLKQAEDIIAGSSLSYDARDEMRKEATELQKFLQDYMTSIEQFSAKVNQLSGKQDTVHDSRLILSLSISDLRMKAANLIGNATQIKRSNVHGAYNMSIDYLHRASEADKMVSTLPARIKKVEMELDNIEDYVLTQKKIMANKALYNENEVTISRLRGDFRNLTNNIMDINQLVCAKRGNPCDETCGGGGCDMCGGLGCNEGSTNKVSISAKITEAASGMLGEKEDRIQLKIDKLGDTTKISTESYNLAKQAYEKAKNMTDNIHGIESRMNALIKGIRDFMRRDNIDESQIQKIIDEVMKIDISMTPEEVKRLIDELNAANDRVGNVDSVSDSDKQNALDAKRLLEKSIEKMNAANDLLNKIGKVRENLRQLTVTQGSNTDMLKSLSNIADDTTESAQGLKGRLTDVRKRVDVLNAKSKILRENVTRLSLKYTENKINIDSVKVASENAEKEISLANKVARTLRNQYKGLREQLVRKIAATDDAEKRSKRIGNEIVKVHFDMTKIQSELEKIATAFKRNMGSLLDLTDKIKALLVQATDYQGTIKDKGKNLKDCGSTLHVSGLG